MYMVIFVLHDPDKVDRLLQAWEKAGIRGATILYSSGLGRLHGSHWMDDIPLFPSLESLSEHEEFFSRTIFTVVNSEEIVNRLIESTEAVVGNLSQPETGFLVVLPVLRTYGLDKNRY
jgi:nitrogen regulatory protein PII